MLVVGYLVFNGASQNESVSNAGVQRGDGSKLKNTIFEQR